MLTAEQKHRIEHQDWPEYLEDVSAHWSEFILLGEYDLWHLTTINSITKRINEMETRFRKTFYPQLDE